MATNKPRFSVTFSDATFEKIKKFQTEHNISTQSKAVANLVEIAVNEIENSSGTTEAASMNMYDRSPRMTALYAVMNQLNDHGQEKVLEYANDLVSSGNYLKSDTNHLGKVQGA